MQKEYQTLLPGDKCRQHTFVNHAWIFREAGTRRRMSIEDHGGQVPHPKTLPYLALTLALVLTQGLVLAPGPGPGPDNALLPSSEVKP